MCITFLNYEKVLPNSLTCQTFPLFNPIYSNPSILAIFWAKQNIAKIEVILVIHSDKKISDRSRFFEANFAYFGHFLKK